MSRISLRKSIKVVTTLVAMAWQQDSLGQDATSAPRPQCVDSICAGDRPPVVDQDRSVMKIGGQYFSAPKVYGGSGGVLGFYWPSRTPASDPATKGRAPEVKFLPTGQAANFYEVAIEVFIRSTNIPPEPRGYRLLELAESKGWITSRKVLRAGLEKIEMKHVVGPNGHYIDHVTYYVATNAEGSDGQHPVATCSHQDPRNGGGTGFLWRPGVWVGIRMNQKHCADWPEIYRELMRVLGQVKPA